MSADLLIAEHERLEQWKNVAAGKFFVKKFGERAGKTETEMVGGGSVFGILPAERRLNQRAVHNPKDDPFTNGNFVHIHLIEGESDTEALKASTQGLTEDELKAIYKLKGAAFANRIEQLTERVTLQRLLEVGVILDVPNSKVSAVSERLVELFPTAVPLREGERRSSGSKVAPSRGEKAAGDPK